MRRVFIVLIAMNLFAALGAAPAAADRPTTFSESFSFVDLNPCDGLDHEITIVVDVSLHLHGNGNGNVVATIQRSGFTDSGYERLSRMFVLVGGVRLFTLDCGGRVGFGRPI